MLRSIAFICLSGFATLSVFRGSNRKPAATALSSTGRRPGLVEIRRAIARASRAHADFWGKDGDGRVLKAVDAKGYFDVEVTCEGPFVQPPESCFLDGIQIGTGATLGKRNLRWTKSDKILLQIRNLRSNRVAELKPKDSFLTLLPRNVENRQG